MLKKVNTSGFFWGEKPLGVSWDEIHELLWKAHERNRAAGMCMLYPSLSGSELEKLLGDNGRCFVAMDEGKVVGTCSFKPIKRNNWYSKAQKTAYLILEGVLPEYEGNGIYAQLCDIRQKYIEQLGISFFEMDTAEKNFHSQEILLKNGFRYLSFKSYRSGTYAVIMGKWKDGCPFPKWYCTMRYILRKYYIKVRFKPGKVKRFGI